MCYRTWRERMSPQLSPLAGHREVVPPLPTLASLGRLLPVLPGTKHHGWLRKGETRLPGFNAGLPMLFGI